MAAAQLMLPANRAFSSNGLPLAGAVAKLYTTGTLTPANFYADSALTVSLGSSLTANAAGRLATPAYQNTATAFRLRLETSAGVELDDIDPFYFGQVYVTVNSLAITPQMFGAVGDGTTDDAVALQAWLDAGGMLRLPVGEYYSSAKLILRKNAVIEGEGYGFDNREPTYADVPGSRIRFPVGVGGLDIQTQTTLTDVAAVLALGGAAWTQEGAMHSRISNLALIGPDTGAAATGLILRTLAHLDNVHVIQFKGKGIDISATTLVDGFAEYGNASVSSLRNCRAQENGSHGLHIRGADANTILVDNFNAFDNGGNGIFDESLIGNTYLKPHCAGNDLLDIKAVRDGAFNTFVHPYVETGGAVEIGGFNTVVGSDLTSANTPPDQPPGLYSSAVAATVRYRVHWNATLAAISTNIGYMFREADYGTVIQGKGIGADVGLANKSGLVVAYIPTGLAILRISGSLSVDTFVTLNTTSAWPGLSGGNGTAALLSNTTHGLYMGGSGATNDTCLVNKDGTIALSIPTGTVNVSIVGNADVASGKVYKVNGTQVVAAQGASVADAAALTSVDGTNAVAAPTQAEFNALVAEFNKLRTDVGAVRTPLNTLLARQRTHGLIAT